MLKSFKSRLIKPREVGLQTTPELIFSLSLSTLKAFKTVPLSPPVNLPDPILEDRVLSTCHMSTAASCQIHPVVKCSQLVIAANCHVTPALTCN